MPDAMDLMISNGGSSSRSPHVPGSIPPIARRIIPVGYVPEEGEVLPGITPLTLPPVAELPLEPVVEVPPTSVIDPVPIVPVVAPAEIVEVVEQWQAKDDAGNPVGPPSKIVGRGATQVEAYQDLTRKLRDANINAARKIKEYRDKYRTYDQEKISLTAEPQPLSTERRIEIQRLLADPATMDEGYALLYQAQFGESPEQVRERQAKEREASWIEISKQQTNTFLQEHPDFPVGAIAKKLLLDEVQLRKNAAETEGKTFGWTAHNLEIVYDDLVERGLITPRQLEQVSEPVVASQIAPPVRVSQEPPQVATPANPPATAANTSEAPGTRPRGTRFSTMSTEHGSAPPTETRQADYEAFRREVNELSLDELKQKIRSDRKFKARLDSLPLRR